jgi:tRNA uridine 5-carboxymethylaminomethyl modification enzyme
MTNWFQGLRSYPAGRYNEEASTGLAASLKGAQLRISRLKTGTPARLDRNSINFSDLLQQIGDSVPEPFSYINSSVDNAVRLGLVFPNVET